MANRGAIADTQNPVDEERFAAWAKSQGLDPQQAKVALSMGLLTDPVIQAQYKNDPRTQLGLKAIEAGSDMSPLQGGIAEGLARVAQGFMGGRISRDQKSHYDKLQEVQNARRDQVLAGVRGVAPTDTVASALTTLPPETAAGFQGSGMIKGVAQPGIANPTVAPASGGVNAPVLKPRGQPAVALDGNNPGGLNDGSFARRQPGYVGNNGRYAAFDTPENGLRAQQTLLKSYVSRGYDTPLKIASRWAPSEDGNNPGSYAQTISKQLGISVNDKLSHADVERFSLAQAHTENARFGSEHTTVDSTTTGTTTNTSPALNEPPPVMAVPDLPKPMEAPDRPTLPQKVRSMRMAIVDKLLGDRGIPGLQNIDSSIINQFLPEGLNEEQKAAEQARQDEVDFAKTEYASKLGRYAHQQDSAYDSAVKSHDEAAAFNRGLTLEQYRAKLQSSETMRKERHDDIQKQLDRDNELLKAQATANKPAKMGIKDRADWRAIRTSISDSDAILKTVKDPKNAKHFGLQYGVIGSVPFVGNTINQKVDPEGIKVRGVINDMRNVIVHARAGASQTGIELSQLDKFLPKDGDTAKELQDKMEGLREFLDRADAEFVKQFGADAYGAGGTGVAPTTTATATASIAPPAPVVAPPSKFAPDAKGHRGTLKL